MKVKQKGFVSRFSSLERIRFMENRGEKKISLLMPPDNLNYTTILEIYHIGMG
jgi:hypothetical protein